MPTPKINSVSLLPAEETEEELLKRAFAENQERSLVKKDEIKEAKDLAKKALARVRQLEREVVVERARTSEAMARAADLHAQRLVLALACASSVPSLAVALLAHRYELHELETRSDAVGMALVTLILLAALAWILWQRMRKAIKVPSREHVIDVALRVSNTGFEDSSDRGGLRRRKGVGKISGELLL